MTPAGRWWGRVPVYPRSPPQLTCARCRADHSHDFDLGAFLPAAEHACRVRADLRQTPVGERSVPSVISRDKRDEALRELVLQLAIADALVLAAASFVGYRTGVRRSASGRGSR